MSLAWSPQWGAGGGAFYPCLSHLISRCPGGRAARPRPGASAGGTAPPTWHTAPYPPAPGRPCPRRAAGTGAPSTGATSARCQGSSPRGLGKRHSFSPGGCLRAPPPRWPLCSDGAPVGTGGLGPCTPGMGPGQATWVLEGLRGGGTEEGGGERKEPGPLKQTWLRAGQPGASAPPSHLDLRSSQTPPAPPKGLLGSRSPGGDSDIRPETPKLLSFPDASCLPQTLQRTREKPNQELALQTLLSTPTVFYR